MVITSTGIRCFNVHDFQNNIEQLGIVTIQPSDALTVLTDEPIVDINRIYNDYRFLIW